MYTAIFFLKYICGMCFLEDEVLHIKDSLPMLFKSPSVLFSFVGGSEGKASACNAGDLVRSLGQEDPLKKEMATHSSTLAWIIPWTEKPGRLQSMGSQRIGHD